MGSYNVTCGLSNLSINRNDKVKLLLLRENPYSHRRSDIGGGYCYPTDIWQPIMFPISGSYNDYGALHKIQENDNTKVIFDYFMNNSKTSSGTAGSVMFNIPDHNKDTYSNIDSIEKLIKVIERGYVKIREYGSMHQVSFMFILDDIYNNARVIARDYDEGWHGDYNKTLNFYLNNHKNDPLGFRVGDYYLNESEVPSALKKINYYKIIDNKDVNFFLFAKLLKEDFNICVMHEFFSQTNNKDEMTKLMEESFQLDLFIKASRKHYSPQSGVGSDDNNYEVLKKFYQKCNVYIDKKLKEWEDENG